MTIMTISTLPLNTVLYVHSEKEIIELDPEYQRASDIWTLEKRQLLIDSIINGYDIPKIYFHKFPVPKVIQNKEYSYAIIDGKQRLSSIWSFIDGEFPLSEDIEYLRDRNVKLASLTYRELGQLYPKLKLRFDSFPLSIVAIETDDLDLIEDMFSRLNEAVPLSAAEKRNAYGGPMTKVIRQLAGEKFCVNNLPFGNKRYRHYDLITKFLLTEEKDDIVDTKKMYLDAFVRNWKGKRNAEADKLGEDVKDTLEEMSNIFTNSDKLLRSVGMLVIYYHIFRIANKDGWASKITRNKLLSFEKKRVDNKSLAENDITSAAYDLLEFDRYSQTPNDAYATSFRLRIMLEKVFQKEMPQYYSYK